MKGLAWLNEEIMFASCSTSVCETSSLNCFTAISRWKASPVSLFQTFHPKGLFSFWNHCPYSHVLSVPVESLGMSLLLPQHYLKNWLTYMFYFSSANEEIFLFHVLFDATVGETSLDFFLTEDSFSSVVCLFFFFLN